MSNWVYLMLFRKNSVDGKFYRCQQVHLNMYEFTKFVNSCEKICQEVDALNKRTDLPKPELKENIHYSHWVWDINESNKRKVRVACTKYQPEKAHSMYVKVGLFKRDSKVDEFREMSSFVNFTLDEF